MKQNLTAGLVAAAALLLTPLAALADNHEPDLASVWIFAPKQGETAKFEKAMREHAALREKGGDSRDWEVYSVAMGDHMGIYQVRHGWFDWADEDAYNAENAEKGFGEHFQETVAPLVDRMHHYFERRDIENSYWPDDLGQKPYYGVTSWVWKEEAGPEVTEVRKKMSQALIEAGWGEEDPWLWLSRIGGKPMIMIVSPYDSYADMAPPEKNMYEFMLENSDMEGEEMDGIFATFGAGFSSSDYTVWQHRPDLSVSAAE